MILYHGSTVPVQYPKIRLSDAFLDFGVGFYATTSYEQAHRWASIKMRREGKKIGYVAVYDFDFEAAQKESLIKKFDTASLEWLTFVVNNRNGVSQDATVDMHIGPVADDNVYQSIRLFETGIYDAEETVKRLKTELLHDQWTFHTDKILSYLRFVEYKEVKDVGL